MLSLLNTTFTNTLRQGSTLVGSLLSKLKARSTFFENETCTKATLKNLNTAGLLEKASIITTPTAYNVGFINSVKPKQTLGSELIINGDFATDSNWSKGTGWTISGGTANCDGTQTSSTKITQNKPFPIAKYQITVTVSLTAGSVIARFEGGGANNFGNITTVGTNTYVQQITTTGVRTKFLFRADSDFIGTIDNISLKEVIDADFTFTRNNAGTRVNASGNIESVGVDLPRIDYTGGGCGSWLLEPQSTNLCSDYLSLSAVNGGVVTLNDSISPDGTQNATKVNFSSGNNNIGGKISISSSASASTEYTFSFYAKNSSGDGTFRLRIDTNVVAILVNQTFTATSEWVRYTHTFTTDALSSSFSSNSRFRKSTTTDNNEVLFYGMQLEEGSFATSVIPTSGSTATRAVDSATDAGSSDLISSTEGVLYAELKSISEFVDSPTTISINNNNTTNRLLIYKLAGNNKLQFQIKNPSATVDFASATTNTAFDKVVIKYKSSDYAVWINGVEVFTDTTTSSVPTGLSRLDFSEFDSSSIFQGNARCVAVFKEALTDSELETLTSWVSFSDMANGQLYTIQ